MYSKNTCIRYIIFLQFKNRFGSMYKLKPSDAFTCCIKQVATSTEVSHVVEPLPFAGHEQLKVSFTVRLAGKYSILLKTSSGPIAGSPHVRMYLPGESQTYKQTQKRRRTDVCTHGYTPEINTDACTNERTCTDIRTHTDVWHAQTNMRCYNFFKYV